MMLFKLEGSTERYTCPDTWRDIPVRTFLHYVQHIAPNFPEQLQAMAEQQAVIARLEPEIKKYEKKHGTDAGGVMRMVNDGSAPKKTAAYFPAIYNEYAAAQEQAKALEKVMGIGWYAKTYLPYMAATVSHFTGVPLEACNGIGEKYMLVGTLEYLFECVMRTLRTEPKDEGKQAFDIAGERYTLPDGLMKRSTLIEFAEAAQFEEAMQSIKHGDYMAMLDIAAVLLRPEGVPYSEEQYEQGRKVLEAHMDMHDLYQVGFFFGKAKREIRERYPELYAGGGNQGDKRLRERFGWYLLIKHLAECGVFNIAGLTPIESACKANLYEAMQYLAAKSAEAQIAEAMQKQK